MWLEFAKDAGPDPKEAWIRELYQHDYELASEDDRQAAVAMHDTRAKGTPPPSPPGRNFIKTLLRPLGLPLLIGSAPPAQ